MSDTQKNAGKDKKEDSLIGELFDDKYRITDKIGGGGMGLVYEAQHEWMERKVALKVLRPNFIDAEEYEVFLERFKREAQTASRINHPNAVTIYDFGIYQQMPYLAMQYIDGLTLTDLIKQDGPMDEARAIALLLQVLDATIAAHALQIIHRDIKPDNVMVSKSANEAETAHVLDFGIAKVLDNSEANANMTLPGKTVGTPRYMSPEQVLAGEIDVRTDIYALGLVLYEMVSGDIPFKADSSMQLMFHHVNTAPLPIREVYSISTISKQLERLIMKALEKDPQKRFQNCSEMKEALLALSSLDNKTTISLPRISAITTIDSKQKTAYIASGVFLAVLLLFVFWPSAQENIDSSSELASEQIALNDTPSSERVPVVTTDKPKPELKTTPVLVQEPAKTKEPLEIEENKTDLLTKEEPKTNPLPLEISEKVDAKNSLLEKPKEPEVVITPEEPVKTTVSVEPEDKKELDTKSDEKKSKSYAQTATLKQTKTTKPVVDETPKVSTKEQENKVSSKSSKNDSTRPYANTNVNTLIGFLAGEDRKAREKAAIELQSRGKAPVAALIKALESHKSPRARYWAVFILGKLRAVEATDAIVKALDDPSGMVSQTAKKALRAANPKRANKILGVDQNQKDSGFMGLF